MIFTIVLYILIYLVIGFLVSFVIMKVEEETIESIKTNEEFYVGLAIFWPLGVIFLILSGLWYVLKNIGLWILTHIIKIPLTKQTSQPLDPSIPIPMQPAEDSSVEKIIEETTGNFEFMDLE